MDRMSTLKVDNLTFRTTVEQLQKAFSKFGDIGDVYIPRDHRTKESRGFAFIRFYDRHDADDAMDEMDGFMLDGRPLRVQEARYGRPNNDRFRGGRDRGGRDRRRSRSRSRERRRRSHSRDRRDRDRSESPPKRSRRSNSKSRSRSR